MNYLELHPYYVLYSFLTSSRSLKAIKQVDPLDVVGESGVGHQGLVAVDVVYGKLKGQFVHAH